MPRIADALERESRTVDLEQDGFERLLARHERKQRNRRIRAGVVAVIVALATAAALARSIAWERMPAIPPPVGAGEVLIGVRALGAQDPESGQARTIVDDKAIPARAEDITGAAWSPDRAWVAFRAGGLWVADTTGGRAHQLTADQGDDPWAWSPTEDRIAFVRGRDVTLFDAAAGRETDLGTVAADEDSEGYAVHSLVWSPDGTRIAYDGRPGSGSVYMIDVGTGALDPSVVLRTRQAVFADCRFQTAVDILIEHAAIVLLAVLHVVQTLLENPGSGLAHLTATAKGCGPIRKAQAGDA